MTTKPRITVLGGGTGTYTVLTALKTHATLSAVVSIADSGGSSGELRDAYGILPPGDIRKALVALSEKSTLFRELMEHRFCENPSSNGLANHSVGNLLLLALNEMSQGDALAAIRRAEELFDITPHRVLPASAEPAVLGAILVDGTVIKGEHLIDQAVNRPEIERCYLAKATPANPEALEAIRAADLIVLGPGDLYTSLVPVLLNDGVTTAIANRRGKLCYVLNLANKLGQTQDFKASRFVERLSEYLPKNGIDAVLVNTEQAPVELAEHYAKNNEPLVVNDLSSNHGFNVVEAPLLAPTSVTQQPNDKLKRSLVRHDPDKLAKAILSLLA